MQLTFGTRLAVTFHASGSSTWQHHRQKSLLWPAVGIMAVGSIIGAWTKMFFEKNMTSKRSNQDLLSCRYLQAGLSVSSLNRYQRICGPRTYDDLSAVFSNQKGCRTSSGVIIFTTTISTIKYIYHGWGDVLLPKGCIGFVCPADVIFLGTSSTIAAPMGAKFNQKIKILF